MSRTQYFTASTLDGFIADADNSVEWLFRRHGEPDGLLNYDAFIVDVGALAMGATSYEWILEHAGEPWPYDQPCWVFTHRELPHVHDAPITFARGAVAPVHREMVDAAGGRNVWIVGGGDLVGQFADAGLLDEVIVQFAPITVGGGAPLLPRRVELRLEEAGRNGDFVSARYSVVRASDSG